MQQSSRFACVFCQYGAFSQNLTPNLLPRQHVRFMAQMQRRKPPSRMVLSESVAASSARSTIRGRSGTRRGAEPFGGINITKPPRDALALTRGQPLEQPSSRTRGRGEEKQRKRNDETFHALKMQRQLSVISYGQRNALKEEISEVDSFGKLGLLPVIEDAIIPQALGGQEGAMPTPIQRIAIPALKGQQIGRRKRHRSSLPGQGTQQFLLAAETGSGKTLAYLLPILDTIKRAEFLEDEAESSRQAEVEMKKQKDPYFVEPPPLDDRKHPTSGRPRAIILLPTSELVHQVAQLIRSMAYKIKVRSKGISSSDSAQTIRRRVFSEDGIDILVSTPHILSAIASTDPNILGRVRHLVIDEADSLMDRSFSKLVQPIIDKSASAVEQIIFCSATIPRSLETHLRTQYPDLRRIVTPSLHAIPRRVQLSVVDIEKIPYQGNRDLACADAIFNINKLKHEATPGQPETFSINRVLVFVNERESTTEVAEYLQGKGIDAIAFNRDATNERQSEILRDFTARPPHISGNSAVAGDGHVSATGDGNNIASEVQLSPSPARAESEVADALRSLSHQLYKSPRSPHFTPKLKNVKVLVSTDLLSRGVDTLSVRHVVLYDVPHTATDFIHRLGRVGRMKMRGRGIVLVGKHDRRDVVREIQEAMYRGQALI